MKCPEHIINLMHDYLDGDIGPGDEKQLKEHLQQCPACAAHFHELTKTVAFIQYASHVPSPSDFTMRVMEKLPREKKRIRVQRWMQRHPFLTAASLFILLTTGSLFTAWNGEEQFSVSTRENVIIRGHTVIVPKGETVKGDIVVAGTNSLVSNSRNCSGVKSRCSSPFFVIDTEPVSSDTTTVTLSVTSLIPNAARWRVPNSFEINGLSESGCGSE